MNLKFNHDCFFIFIFLGRNLIQDLRLVNFIVRSLLQSIFSSLTLNFEVAKKGPLAHPGNRTPVSTVGGYYDTTTPDALLTVLLSEHIILTGLSICTNNGLFQKFLQFSYSLVKGVEAYLYVVGNNIWPSK